MLDVERTTGPVTRAIAAMGRDPEPPRRAWLKAAGVATALMMIGGRGAHSAHAIWNNPDAAILALGPVIVGLIATAEHAHKNHTAAEELVFEMTGPVPTKPRDATFFNRFADYQAAMACFEADMMGHQTRIAQVEERTGYAALEAAAYAAETAVVDACASLAEMRAVTLPGLILKARLAERGNWDELSRSIVADLLAMGGAA